MGKNQEKRHRFGLIGKNISYSFSKNYFTQKFKDLHLEKYEYSNFDIATIDDLPKLITQDIRGLNVTIPYKEKVMDFLDAIDDQAKEVGAVNTIKIVDDKLKGFNTDVYGFEESLKMVLQDHHKKALVLGTGGASKAIIFVLEKLKIDYLTVSRNPEHPQIAYSDITRDILDQYKLIINCTPLGTSPKLDEYPKIPYEFLTGKHLLFDLIYNPPKTTFLRKGENKGAAVENGLKMLQFQAEKSWSIWNL